MNIFKFKDDVDGNYAFVISDTEEKAREILKEKTSLSLSLVSMMSYKEYNLPIIFYNKIMPF